MAQKTNETQPSDWMHDSRCKMLLQAQTLFPHWQYRALEVLATIGSLLSQTAWYKAVVDAGISNERGNQPTKGEMAQIMKVALAHGIVGHTIYHSVYVNPLISELLARAVVERGEFRALRQTQYSGFRGYHQDNSDSDKYYGCFDISEGIESLRYALYEKRFVQARAIIAYLREKKKRQWHEIVRGAAVFTEPFDPHYIEELSEIDKLDIGRAVFVKASQTNDPVTAACEWAKNQIANGLDPQGILALSLGEQSIQRGDRATAEKLAKSDAPLCRTALAGCLAALDGKAGEAIDLFNQGLKIYRKTLGNKSPNLDGFCGVLFCGSLLRAATAESLKQLGTILTYHFRDAQTHLTSPWYAAFVRGVEQVSLQGSLSVYFSTPAELATAENRFHLPLALESFWANSPKQKEYVVYLQDLAAITAQQGNLFLASEALALAARIDGEASPLHTKANELRGSIGPCMLIDSLIIKDKWELALESLALIKPKVPVTAQSANSRYLWYVENEHEFSWVDLELYEQARGRSGAWNQPKAVALSRKFLVSPKYDAMNEKDQNIVRLILDAREARSLDQMSAARTAALTALAGHENVYWDDDLSTPIQIEAVAATLQVTQSKKGILLALVPPPNGREQVVERSGPYSLTVTTFTREQLAIAKIIKEGLIVPENARERLNSVLATLSPAVAIASDTATGHETVETDPRTVVRLTEDNGRIRAGIFCRPSPGLPLAIPARGNPVIIGTVDGKAVGFKRDFEQERRFAAPVVDAAQRWLVLDGQEYGSPDCESALEFLEQIGMLATDCTVEWARGTPITIRTSALTNQFISSVQKRNDWFEVTGTLKIDNNQMLSFAQLLDLIEASPSQRFLKLDSGEYLALTERFRKRITEMAAAGQVRGSTLRLSPASVLWVDEALREIAPDQSCPEWSDKVNRLQEALECAPAIPSGFDLRLRDYQQEGFVWLARRAQAGLGACLADDMGLGKTIQALALLVHRAHLGPALVIAPTSVCSGWLSEAQRFAPSLNVLLLTQTDRQATIAAAGPLQVVVVSYGILVTEQELLCSREWATVILDEAQAIKNAQTQRSQSVMKLVSSFRLAMSGTPLENHLGELWTLMHFLNPGLLGSAKGFAARYMGPSGNDPQRRRVLRRLITPFVLRRIKEQVLDELPQKTEIQLSIEPGPAESAFYEALRLRAVEELDSAEEQADKGRIQILAAITRLRRACCNPGIVDPLITIASAKMESFEAKTDELVDNGHRALVFSQFVDHLSLLRSSLDRRNITYQYLDGSTPAAARSKAVRAFQEGSDPLFLISLKAGGVGLNLTAADYVFIMDPWWNPAVEDQAADRAHRIGQQRPVTIYRFVMRGTIEEKIVALHRDKRDLAQSVLDGTEGAARLNSEELLRLIRENDR